MCKGKIKQLNLCVDSGLIMCRKSTLATACLAAVLSCGVSPVVAEDFNVSLEVQHYFTGTIAALQLERWLSNQHAVHGRLGLQRIRHEDFGEHDDERGDGFGFSLGYRYYLSSERIGWSAGFRTDLWWNSLDWTDNINQPDERTGHTDVTVLQPTIEAGYLYPLNNNFFITPTIAYGFEINIDTDGEDTGEGPILLLGLHVGRRF